MKFLSFLTQRDVLVLDYQHSRRDVTCKPAIGHFRVPPGLCIKTRLSAQPLIWKSFFILRQIKLILTRKVVYLASFWKWGFSFGARKWPIPESYLCSLPSSNLHSAPPPQPLLISFCSRKALGELSYSSSAVFNHTLIQSVVTTAMSWHAYPSGQSPYKPTNWQRCLPSEAIRSCIR